VLRKIETPKENTLMSSMSLSQVNLAALDGDAPTSPASPSAPSSPRSTTTETPIEELGKSSEISADDKSSEKAEQSEETEKEKEKDKDKDKDKGKDKNKKDKDKGKDKDKNPKSPPISRSISTFFSNSTINLPTAESVSLTGYLKKQGRKMKFLSRYYFTFDPTLKTLSYYPNAKSKKAKAIIHMGRYSIEDLGKATEKGPFMFKISTASKSIVLGADTQDEKENWIAHMRTRIPTTASASIFREQSTIMRGALSPTNSSPPSSPSSSSASIPPMSPPMSPPPLSPVYRHAAQPEEGEPVQHNTVPRVTIEGTIIFYPHLPLPFSISHIFLGRYIFTTPKPKQLERKAKRLNKALAERFPNQTNVVVYDFDFSKSKRGFRLFRLGTLDVYRSLDATTPHFVTHPLPNDADVCLFLFLFLFFFFSFFFLF
jgi:hypothetical protein